jgi:hypothetical protein
LTSHKEGISSSSGSKEEGGHPQQGSDSPVQEPWSARLRTLLLAAVTGSATCFCSWAKTSPATDWNALISSSMVPPRPVLLRLIELLTYVGSSVFLATSLASLVVNSSVGSTVINGVDNGWPGLNLCYSFVSPDSFTIVFAPFLSLVRARAFLSGMGHEHQELRRQTSPWVLGLPALLPLPLSEKEEPPSP